MSTFESREPSEPKGHTMRIVTPEQFAQGYRRLVGAFVVERRFRKIRTLPDGTILVEEPTP